MYVQVFVVWKMLVKIQRCTPILTHMTKRVGLTENALEDVSTRVKN